MSSEHAELHSWLDQKASVGEKDSQGVFTLKQEQSWSKLATYQFTMSEGWVLKIVQAVGAVSGAKLEVTQFAKETVFAVSNVPGWTNGRILDSVFATLQESEALSHLASAIRFLARSSQRPFGLHFSDGTRAVWDGEAMQDLPASPTNLFRLRVSHSEFEDFDTLKLVNKKAVKVRADIASCLRNHCHLAPESIILDGYLVCVGVEDAEFGHPSQASILGFVQVWDKCDLPVFNVASSNRAPEARVGKLRIEFDTRKVTHLVGNNPCYVAGLLSLKTKDKELSVQQCQILWTNDGVVAHREPLNIPGGKVGLGLIISSKGLRTDITGLAPIKNEEYDRRVKLATALFSEHFQDVVVQTKRDGLVQAGFNLLRRSGCKKLIQQTIAELVQLERSLRRAKESE